jgi:hypothetical protein
MTPNPYLAKYRDGEVESLVRSGSIPLRFDSGNNLLLDKADVSMYSSSFTVPISHESFDVAKVETKFVTTFTELT